MARLRSLAPASLDEWPAELEDRHSPHWASERAFESWCERHGMAARQVGRRDNALGRWAEAIEAWFTAHHPDPRWPSRGDWRWLAGSELLKFYNAAHRGAIYLDTGRPAASEEAVNYFLNERTRP